jgi:hypothetical protein
MPPKPKPVVLLKQQVIAHLNKGYGISETCKLLRISRTSYYNWRREDPEFAAECARILGTEIHKDRMLHRGAVAPVGVEASWEDKFLNLYRKTGDRAKAADGCGLTVVQLNERMTPGEAEYDEVFHKRFIEEEQRRLWVIEDSTLRKAEHDMPTARFVLSNLLKEKYGKVGGEVTINNQHWFTSKGESKAKAFMEKRFGDQARPESGVTH